MLPRFAFRLVAASGTALVLLAAAIAASSPAGAWDVHGIPVCDDPYSQSSPVITFDGHGGALIFWSDLRNGNHTDTYAQRVDSTGAPQWSLNGLPVGDGPGTKFSLHVVPDTFGGAFLNWGDNRSGINDIYAQRIDANGIRQWAASGVPICTAANDQLGGPMVLDRFVVVAQPPGIIVAWHDPRINYNDYNIYVNHVDFNGGGQWAANGIALCTAPGNQLGPVMASDGAGVVTALKGAIVAWTDERNGNADVYARRVNAGGVPQWANDGVPVCALPGQQYVRQIVYVGGAVIIAWVDLGRGGVYAQKLDVNGNALWPANGVLVSPGGSSDLALALVSNGAGGAILAWVDFFDFNSDVNAQMIDSNGAPQWGANGLRIAAASYSQGPPALVPSGGGAIVAWVDGRSGIAPEIYAQRIASNGYVLWAPGGVRVSDGGSIFANPVCVGSGSNKAIVAWGSDSDIYANRVLDYIPSDAPSDLEGGLRIEFRSPNPARGAVSLGLQVSRAATVLAEIFDPRGRRVRTIAGPRVLAAGNHLLMWDGKDEDGLDVSPGVYFLRARAGEQSRTVKVVEMR